MVQRREAWSDLTLHCPHGINITCFLLARSLRAETKRLLGGLSENSGAANRGLWLRGRSITKVQTGEELGASSGSRSGAIAVTLSIAVCI